METLATVDDLQDRMSVDATDYARADALLKDASASVRRYTGQDFTETDSTVTLKVRNGRVRLPQRPVTAVASVLDANGNTVNHTWLDGDEWVTVGSNVFDSWAFEPWRNGYSKVTVTYTHGYETIPDEIIGVVCQIAARAYGRPAEDTGMSSESIDGYSYSTGAAAAAGGFGMLPDERLTLEPYRRGLGSIRVGP